MRLRMLGGPEGHPIHPFVVPVPIGALPPHWSSTSTHVRAGELPWLVDGAWWLIGIGLVGAALAAIFGTVDLLRIPRGTRAFTIAVIHLILNVAVAVIFLAGYAWRAGDHVELGQTPWGQLGLSAAGVGLLAASVLLGQSLTYRFGVRVDRGNG